MCSKTEICQRGIVLLWAIFSSNSVDYFLGLWNQEPDPKPDAVVHSVIYDEEKKAKAQAFADHWCAYEGDGRVLAPGMHVPFNACRFKYQFESYLIPLSSRFQMD